MTNIAKFNLALSAILDVPGEDEHPFLTVAKFIFADDKPNANRQAVEYSEFDNIKRTAIGMPVKMRYSDDDLGEHEGSTPIGVIRNMEEAIASDGSHQLIAEALLWKEEYPEEVAFLKEKFAKGEAPGISYELGYADSETKSGVQWIKKVITLAATFVKHPAYGKRTKLLALANVVTAEEIVTEVVEAALQAEIDVTEIISGLESKVVPSGQPLDEGGNQMEEELQQQKALAASLSQEIEALKATIEEKDAAIEAVNKENESLKFAALVDSRTRRIVEAGFTLEADAEKAEKKKALWASLTDEQFEEYLSDLIEVKASVKTEPVAQSPALAAIARASAGSAMPRPEPKEQDLSTLKNAMRGLARPNSID